MKELFLNMWVAKIFIRFRINASMSLQETLDKGIDRLFSLSRTSKFLLLLVALGFILRLIAAINITVSADDMHFAVHAINFWHSHKLVVYDQSASLWYYITDTFYHIFGIGQVSSRFAAVLFGSMSILVMFFFVKEFFDERIAFIAALLVAVSPFHLRNMLAEMDAMVMFFVLLGSLYFIRAVKQDKSKLFAYSGLFLGLGILTKFYAVLFVPALLAYALTMNYHKHKKIISPGVTKHLLFFLIVAGIFLIPTLTHNYLLYKDKGFMDLIFTNAWGTNANQSSILRPLLSPFVDTDAIKTKGAEYYAWDTGFGHGADWRGFFLGHSIHDTASPLPSGVIPLTYIYHADPLVAILGLLGLLYCLVKKRAYGVYALYVLIFVYSYLASRILLPKHYIFLLLILIPGAALMLEKVYVRAKHNFPKLRFRYLIFFLIILSLLLLAFKPSSALGNFYTQSAVGQVISYSSTLPKDSLIVADSRIYRGEIHWMFAGKNYIESSYLPQILDASQKSGNSRAMTVYYLECVLDDCGWGTIAGQPEFNKSMEEITDFFKQQGQKVKEIRSADYQSPYFPLLSQPETYHFALYKATLPIDPALFPSLEKTKVWFLYPIGYDTSIAPLFDAYQTHTSLDRLLDSIAHLIVYLGILVAFLSILFVLYCVIIL